MRRALLLVTLTACAHHAPPQTPANACPASQQWWQRDSGDGCTVDVCLPADGGYAWVRVVDDCRGTEVLNPRRW
jgi:hypothetical protein